MLIFLVGYMGSGKSTLGRSVARKMMMKFCDMDSLIESREGKSVSEIFAEHGESYFRSVERAVLEGFSVADNLVIATGGGVPCFGDNMALMNKKGMTIYISVKAGILASRLANSKSSRPILANKSSEELKAFVEQMLSEREPFYREAAYIVEGDNIKPNDICSVLR